MFRTVSVSKVGGVPEITSQSLTWLIVLGWSYQSWKSATGGVMSAGTAFRVEAQTLSPVGVAPFTQGLWKEPPWAWQPPAMCASLIGVPEEPTLELFRMSSFPFTISGPCSILALFCRQRFPIT